MSRLAHFERMYYGKSGAISPNGHLYLSKSEIIQNFPYCFSKKCAHFTSLQWCPAQSGPVCNATISMHAPTFGIAFSPPNRQNGTKKRKIRDKTRVGVQNVRDWFIFQNESFGVKMSRLAHFERMYYGKSGAISPNGHLYLSKSEIIENFPYCFSKKCAHFTSLQWCPAQSGSVCNATISMYAPTCGIAFSPPNRENGTKKRKIRDKKRVGVQNVREGLSFQNESWGVKMSR
jgi:hypothetical protein